MKNINESDSDYEDPDSNEEEEKKQYEEEIKSPELGSSTSQGIPSDSEILRVLILNTIYTFNSETKVKIIKDKLGNYYKDENFNKSKQSNSSSSSKSES